MATSLIVEVGANVARLQRDMNQITRTVDSASATMRRAFIGVGAALAGAFSVRAIQQSIKATLDMADATAKMSQSLGVSVENLSAYRHMAELSGTSFDQLSKGIGQLARNMAIARDGTGEASRAFERLGITTQTAEGVLRDSNIVFTEIAERFARMEDGAEKTSASMQIFGRAGKELIPLLNEGGEGIKAMRLEAERLGIVMTAKMAKSAELVNDNFTRLSAVTRGITISIVERLLPSFEKMSNRMVEFASDGKMVAEVAATIDTGFKILISSATAVAVVFTSVGKSIASVTAAMTFAAQGQFKEAWAALDIGGKDIAENVESALNTIKDAWTDTASAVEIDYLKIKKSFDKTASSTDDLKKSVQELIEKYRDMTATLGMTEKEAAIYRIGIKHAADLNEYETAQVLEAVEAYYRKADALAENKKAQENLERIQKEQAQESKRIAEETAISYQYMLDRIQDATADIFYDIFTGLEDGWKTLIDKMKDWFLRAMAEMAAKAAMQRIIVPIIPSFAGGTGGGLSGLGFLGNIIPGTGGGVSGGLTPVGGMLPGGAHATAGVSWGSALGAAGLGALGYSTIGGLVGLPQSKYSTMGAGAGAGIGFAIGGPIGAGIGALGGGLLGSMFGKEKIDYIGGSSGIASADMLSGAFASYGPAGSAYSSTIGSYISEQASILQGLVTKGIIEKGILDPVRNMAIGIDAMKVDPKNWEAFVNDLMARELPAFKEQFIKKLGEILPSAVEESFTGKYGDKFTDRFGENLSKALEEGGLEAFAKFTDTVSQFMDSIGAITNAEHLASFAGQLELITDKYYEQAKAAKALGVSMDVAFEAVNVQLKNLAENSISTARSAGELALATADLRNLWEARIALEGSLPGDIAAMGESMSTGKAAAEQKKAAAKEQLADEQLAYAEWEWYAWNVSEDFRLKGGWANLSSKISANIAQQKAIISEAEADIKTWNDNYAAFVASGNEELGKLFDNFDADMGLLRSRLADISIGETASSFRDSLNEVNQLLDILEGTGREVDIASIQNLRTMLIDDFFGSLKDMAAQATMSELEYQINKLNGWYSEQIEIIQALQGVLSATEYNQAMDDLGLATQYQVQQIVDSVQTIASAWADVVDSVRAQINSLIYSTANPATAQARLEMAQAELTGLLGGQGMQAYLAGGQADISRIQDIIGTIFSLGQEAYQRPSLEYQGLYDTYMGQLRAIEQYAESQVSVEEILETQVVSELEKITEGTNLNNGVLTAILEVLMKQRGAGSNGGRTIDLTNNGLDGNIQRYLSSGEGRKKVQQIAAGR